MSTDKNSDEVNVAVNEFKEKYNIFSRRKKKKIRSAKPKFPKLVKGTNFKIEGALYKVIGIKSRNRYVIKSLYKNK